MNKIIIDFLYSFIKTPYSAEMQKKFEDKLPIISIEEVVTYILENKLQSNFIITKYPNISNNIQMTYLLKIDKNKFEIFDFERGNIHVTGSYTSQEDALFNYLDAIFNIYGMAAIDSIINK